MKNFLFNNYHKHLILGALIGICISIALHLFSYNQTAINLIVGFSVGFAAGLIWEGEQTYYHQKVKWDWMDVIYSGIGALIGSLIITTIF